MYSMLELSRHYCLPNPLTIFASLARDQRARPPKLIFLEEFMDALILLVLFVIYDLLNLKKDEDKIDRKIRMNKAIDRLTDQLSDSHDYIFYSHFFKWPKKGA